MRQPDDDKPVVYAFVTLLVLAVFGLDMLTDLGTATGVLYFIPLTLCLATSRPIAPLIVSGVCVLLIWTGYVFSPPAPTEALHQIAQLNRSISAAVVIALGLAGRWFIATKVRVEVQEWINAGHSGLSARMQGEKEVGELARGVVAFLAEYVGAQVGSVYIAETSDGFTRKGVYGLDESSRQPDVIAAGHTLVGRVGEDGKVLVINDVPPGYVDVSSGLGRATPRTLVLVPAATDGVVNGVVELAFFSAPKPSTLELLTDVAESIAVAIRSAHYRHRQAELLEEWQAQAEELTQQQEELRAVNERLEEETRVSEMQRLSLQATETVLRQKAGELERASQYKSEFLANMSHELRTPLNSSLILAKLLIDNKDGNLTPKQVQYAKSIYAAGNELLTLINDILDLAKIEAGRIELHVETVSVPQLVRDLQRRFEPLAADKKLALDFHIDRGCPGTLKSDPQRLQQILTNLLSNAIKFTTEGNVSLAVSTQDERITFRVQDTGIGIPPEHHETIFEAFRQADGTTNRKFGGTGLGLSICRELAGLLGGEIGVVSESGTGSTFTLSLPLHAPVEVEFEKVDPFGSHGAWKKAVHASQPGSIAPSEACRLPRAPAVLDDRDAIGESDRVVLVIEDDPIFAQIVYDLAHELDFQCVIAGTADEGLGLAHEYRPAAIVLDVGLPDGSGLAVLEELKSHPETRHIAVHVVSVHDHQKIAREMGAVGYAIKPVAREELTIAFRALEERLSRKMKSILVVEDEPLQRNAIVDLLAAQDVQVTAAPNATEALERLHENTFDCVVLDLMLPEVSGFELLEKMSADESYSFPPVIVYTARTLTPEEEQLLRRHSKSIIIKGARSPERLLEEVTLFLHQVEAELPAEKMRMLQTARNRDAVLENRRLLLVEDDVRNIFALTSVLEPRGLHVDVARNGKEALSRLAAGPPVDLVLMDVMMPEMDGLTATRAIREGHLDGDGNGHPVGPDVAKLPIIAVTAKAMPNDRAECLAAGANDYISKPVDVDQLLSLLRVWMPR